MLAHGQIYMWNAPQKYNYNAHFNKWNEKEEMLFECKLTYGCCIFTDLFTHVGYVLNKELC